jgi:kynureninase
MDAKMSKNKHDDDDIAQVQNPHDVLDSYAQKWQVQTNSEAFAHKLDENDPLRRMREEFFIPKMATLPKSTCNDDLFDSCDTLRVTLVDRSRIQPDQDCIYLCGHSLGLQPKRVRKAMNDWLEDWADL